MKKLLLTTFAMLCLATQYSLCSPFGEPDEGTPTEQSPPDEVED